MARDRRRGGALRRVLRHLRRRRVHRRRRLGKAAVRAGDAARHDRVPRSPRGGPRRRPRPGRARRLPRPVRRRGSRGARARDDLDAVLHRAAAVARRRRSRRCSSRSRHRPTPGGRRELVRAVRAAAAPLARDGLRVALVGSTVLIVALDELSARESAITLPLAVLGSLLVLAFLLRSPRAMAAAAVPSGVAVAADARRRRRRRRLAQHAHRRAAGAALGALALVLRAHRRTATGSSGWSMQRPTPSASRWRRRCVA